MDKMKRQHPFLMLYEIGQMIKNLIFPFIIFAVINITREEISTFFIIAIIGFVIFILVSIVMTFFHWRNFRYMIADNKLIINEGRFISKRRYIALDKIQSHQLQASFLHRLAKLTSLTILTGTTDSDNSTVKLPMITKEEADKVIHQLTLSKQEAFEQSESNIDSIRIDEPKVVYRMTLKEIILFSLTTLYIFAVFPILISLYFKFDDIDFIRNLTEEYFYLIIGSWILIIVIIFILFTISTLVGMVITFLRFGNYQIATDDKRIYIKKGILTQTNYTISRDRINGISIAKVLPKNLLNICSVSLVTMSDSNDEDENTKTDLLFPFINQRKLLEILPSIIPEYPMQDQFKKLPAKSMFMFLIQPSYLLIILIAGVIFYDKQYWYVPVIYAVLLIIFRIMSTLKISYQIKDEFIQYNHGVISQMQFITKYIKIDEVQVKQSFVQRKLNLASVLISTRANPQHTELIEHIPADDAVNIFTWYQDNLLTINKNR